MCGVGLISCVIKLRVGLGIHIICEEISSSLTCVFCKSLTLSEISSVCDVSHYGIFAVCGNDQKIENTIANVTSYRDVTCVQASFSSYLAKIKTTQVLARRGLSRLLSLAEINSNAPTIQVRPLHLIAGFGSIIRVFILCEAVTSGLLGLSLGIAVCAGVRLIDDEAVLELAMLRKGGSEFVLRQSFVNVANVEAGGLIEEVLLVSARCSVFFFSEWRERELPDSESERGIQINRQYQLVGGDQLNLNKGQQSQIFLEAFEGVDLANVDGTQFWAGFQLFSRSDVRLFEKLSTTEVIYCRLLAICYYDQGSCIRINNLITIKNINRMLKLAKQLSAYIYDLFISYFFTIAAHLSLISEMNLSSGNFLDVGCGTGKPLGTIVEQIKKKHSKIVGVDLHPQYTQKAINLFRDDKDVQIYNLDFYTLQQHIKLKFGFIFFSFSFMLLPDQLKALQVAKRTLENNENSRIAFALTLNKDRNSFLSQIKPLIKRFTTVDFGKVVYQDDLFSVIDQAGLQVTKKVRLYKGYNIFLQLSPVYYVQCKIKSKSS